MMSSHTFIPDQFRYEYQTRNFCFHYCYRSAAAALRDPHPLTGGPIVSLHGVYDFSYVRLFGELFERSWDSCVALGFKNPLGYARNHKCHVYIYDLPSGADGLAYVPPSKNAAILAVRNRYLDTAGPCNIHLMQASAAHEFFHAVQYTYRTTSGDPWDWWREATSTFMEGEVFPGSMEYIPYLYHWFDQPHNSLDTENVRHEYGSALFCKFLAENYDRDIIRQVWEQAEPGKEIGQPDRSPFDAISSILLRKHGIPFASTKMPDVFARFVITNYFLASEGYSYKYGGIYKEKFQHIFVEGYCERYPPFQAQGQLDHLGTRYYIFKPIENSNTLNIELRAYLRKGEECPLKGVVACSIDGKIIRTEEFYLEPVSNADGEFSGKITIPEFEPWKIGEVLLAVINCSWGKSERNLARYDLTASVS